MRAGCLQCFARTELATSGDPEENHSGPLRRGAHADCGALPTARAYGRHRFGGDGRWLSGCPFDLGSLRGRRTSIAVRGKLRSAVCSRSHDNRIQGSSTVSVARTAAGRPRFHQLRFGLPGPLCSPIQGRPCLPGEQSSRLEATRCLRWSLGVPDRRDLAFFTEVGRRRSRPEPQGPLDGGSLACKVDDFGW